MKAAYIKYCILCILFIIVSEIIKNVLDFDKLLYNSLAEKFTSNQINEFLNLQNKWKWISYFFIPIYILFKAIITTSILYVGAFFYSKAALTFKNLWVITIQAEFIFLSVNVIKLIWFYFFETSYTLDDIQYFFPLSAINITGYKGIEPWLIYPLQSINLFEIAYIIYLSYQIGYLTKTTPDNGLKIVSSSYIPALLLWVTVVMFFTLNYS